jgi:hypothetical protein
MKTFIYTFVAINALAITAIIYGLYKYKKTLRDDNGEPLQDND